jgi:prolipoprotein diacylglyceryltransferase
MDGIFVYQFRQAMPTRQTIRFFRQPAENNRQKGTIMARLFSIPLLAIGLCLLLVALPVAADPLTSSRVAVFMSPG